MSLVAIKNRSDVYKRQGGGAHHYQNGTMKVLELFAGTRSIGKAFEQRGHEVFSVEWSKDFENIDLYEDISKVTAEDILKLFGKPDVIWASPDCTTFSIAAISHHRKKNPETGSLEPVSAYAKFCDRVDKHVLELIEMCIRDRHIIFYFFRSEISDIKPQCLIDKFIS